MVVYSKKGILIRLLYLAIAIFLWILTFQGRLLNSKRVILCYHGITDESIKAFRFQIQSVVHRVVAMDSKNSSNHRQFSQPAVVITFDDAFENLLSNALPAINELSIPVSIYVVTGYMGDNPGWLEGSNHCDKNKKLMNSNQIKALAVNPLVSLGTHTHTHPKLTSLDEKSMERELRQSKNILEGLIGKKVMSLAFPHGDFNTEVLELARASGLTQFLTLEEQMVSANQPQGKIGRFSMEPNVWPIEFRLTVDGAYSWLFYFRRIIRSLRSLRSLLSK